MTYEETCDRFAKTASDKAWLAKNKPLGFLTGGILAGAYIGIALILAWTCAGALPPPVRPIVLGSVFGIGLLLVLFAGADMFTGYVMYATFGLAKKTITIADAILILVFVWIANLIGGAIFSAIFVLTGGGALLTAPATYVHGIVTAKETAPFVPLLCRAMFCNWLVCLAIWTPARLQNEAAKIWAMAWCLLAFVACGFDHCVADMTAVLVGLWAPTPMGDIAGAAYHLAVVTLGNTIGGAVFVAVPYLVLANSERKPAAA
ncbi:MAG: formate/nitrite transporter family protein [Caulobacteraceae bacterium]